MLRGKLSVEARGLDKENRTNGASAAAEAVDVTEEVPGGMATLRFDVIRRLPERKRMDLRDGVLSKAIECYSFAKSKRRVLGEAVYQMVVKWDDLLDRGEHVGDAAAEWKEELLGIIRNDIDEELGRLRAFAEETNLGNWIADEADVLGVQDDLPLMRDTFHELYVMWINCRVRSSGPRLEPVSWPRLNPAAEEVEEDDAVEGTCRPLRKGISSGSTPGTATTRKQMIRESRAVDSDDDSIEDAQKKKSRKVRRRPDDEKDAGDPKKTGADKVTEEAAAAEESLRKLLKRLDEKGKTEKRRKRRRGKAGGGHGSSPSDSEDDDDKDDRGRKHGKSSKGKKKKKKPSKKSKKDKKRKKKSKKSSGRKGRSPSPSDGSDSSDSSSSSSSSSSSDSSSSSSSSSSEDGSCGSSEAKQKRRMRRAIRDIRRQQSVNTLNVAEIVMKGSQITLQKRAKTFSWAGITGKQGSVLVQYAAMIYGGGGQLGVTHGEKWVRERKLSGVKNVDTYLYSLTLLDILMREDQPNNLWGCAIGECLARFCYGFEQSTASFVGPASQTNKAPLFDALERMRVDMPSWRLAAADEESRRAARLDAKKP